MSLEEHLKKKQYYQTFLSSGTNEHPIKTLGRLFIEEQKKEIPDSSYIRYSQGEVYYHNEDYEAAIYKWSNVHNELEPWARKNSADAYMELELYTAAEEIYLSIQTDSLTLQTEILLHLFSVYEHQGYFEKAKKTIKDALLLNPDYPNITAIARNYFEKQGKWKDAIQLAIDEGKRTGSLSWFEVLQTYIQQGYTKELEPNVFQETIRNVYAADPVLFESFTAALWESYRHSKYQMHWLQLINNFFMQEEITTDSSWNEIMKLYENMYEEFMTGKFTLKELEPVIGGLLTVWLKLVEEQNGVYPAAAIFAWNEVFPDSFTHDVLKRAESVIFSHESDVNIFEKSGKLYESVINWTENRKLELSERTKFLSEKLLRTKEKNVAIVSMTNELKEKFINSFIDEHFLVQKAPVPAASLYRYNSQMILTEVLDGEIKEIKDIEEYREIAERGHMTSNMLIDIQVPNSFLKDSGIAVLDLPNLSGVRPAHLDDYFNFADTLIFVLNSNAELTERELESIQFIKHSYPALPMLFVEVQEQDGGKKFRNVTSQLVDDEVITYTGKNRPMIIEWLRGRLKSFNQEHCRLKRFLNAIKKMTTNLLEQRMQMENQLTDDIQYEKDLLARVNGAIHQLEDLSSEKASMIAQSYILVKEDIEKEIIKTIPILLRETSQSVKEDRDFSNIHLELNDEMNRKIELYINNRLLPKFNERINEWLLLAEQELKHGQQFLDEISEGFNTMFKDNRLTLPCDIKILDDWRRDIDRLANRVHVDKENILLRFTPSQVLLKSTGKFINAIAKNKTILVNRYKNFIEGENYSEVALSVAKKFTSIFELLEQGIERDVAIFFKNSLGVLNELKDKTREEVALKKENLEKLKQNPQSFRDPLMIFQTKANQYTFILEAKEPNSEPVIKG